MLKKNTILKIDTSKASAKGDASTVSVVCPHCGCSTVVLIENVNSSIKCFGCNQLFIIKDDIINEERKREE